MRNEVKAGTARRIDDSAYLNKAHDSEYAAKRAHAKASLDRGPEIVSTTHLEAILETVNLHQQRLRCLNLDLDAQISRLFGEGNDAEAIDADPRKSVGIIYDVKGALVDLGTMISSLEDKINRLQQV
jgi:hypothetical protein